MNTDVIYSSLGADPDLGELVEMFVQEMPDRVGTLETQAQSRDWAQLTRTAHQLKGAAGSYGFHALTPFAARLEHAARAGLQEDQILASLDELLDLCRRVRAGAPQAEDGHCAAPGSGLL
jgi:HPt (histidine-containing phosphotransfer) domain-containing protein